MILNVADKHYIVSLYCMCLSATINEMLHIYFRGFPLKNESILLPPTDFYIVYDEYNVTKVIVLHVKFIKNTMGLSTSMFIPCAWHVAVRACRPARAGIGVCRIRACLGRERFPFWQSPVH